MRPTGTLELLGPLGRDGDIIRRRNGSFNLSDESWTLSDFGHCLSQGGSKRSLVFTEEYLEKDYGNVEGDQLSLEVRCCIVSDLISHSRLMIRQTSLRAR